MPPLPGKEEYCAANENISAGGSIASGNSSEALALAGQMSKAMKAIREQSIQKSNRSSFLDSHDDFKTYCDLRPGQCVLLVHVPELRRFTSDAQILMGDMAWMAAQVLLKNNGLGKPDLRLAVGLRGISAYDRVLLGTYLPEATEEKTGVSQVKEGFECEQELYAWFAPAPDGAASSKTNSQ
jgi:hypothetical protein